MEWLKPGVVTSIPFVPAIWMDLFDERPNSKGNYNLGRLKGWAMGRERKKIEGCQGDRESSQRPIKARAAVDTEENGTCDGVLHFPEGNPPMLDLWSFFLWPLSLSSPNSASAISRLLWLILWVIKRFILVQLIWLLYAILQANYNSKFQIETWIWTDKQWLYIVL